MNQYFSEAVFKQNQFIVNINARFKPKLSVHGLLQLSWANANTGTATNSYNSPGLRPRQLCLAQHGLPDGQLHRAKWGITFNPFLVAQSGRPFNLVTPFTT